MFKTISRISCWLLLLALVLIPWSSVQAIFLRPDLINIPVGRLVDNMEMLVQQKPKDANLLFNLARVHAMAYAQKVDSVQISSGKEQNGAWFGFTPKYVPFQVKKAMTPAEEKEAQKHLEKALSRYNEVIKMQGDHLGALLGHAWLMEQAGKKEEAIKEYRAVIEKGWEKEGKQRGGRLGGNYITVEAAKYLIPLLDKETNKEEIATLQERSQYLMKLPRPITPVVIPLRGGLTVENMLDPNARVSFDADGSGLAKSWTWIRKDAAWLVNDPHRTGKITSALQMFGNVTFWCFWDNGYQAMQSLDDDRDGFLSGQELTGLALWQDVNSNGISETGEVRPLADWGISKLSCQSVPGGAPSCEAFSPQGVYFRDGAVRSTYDVILQPR